MAHSILQIRNTRPIDWRNLARGPVFYTTGSSSHIRTCIFYSEDRLGRNPRTLEVVRVDATSSGIRWKEQLYRVRQSEEVHRLMPAGTWESIYWRRHLCNPWLSSLHSTYPTSSPLSWLLPFPSYSLYQSLYPPWMKSPQSTMLLFLALVCSVPATPLPNNELLTTCRFDGMCSFWVCFEGSILLNSILLVTNIVSSVSRGTRSFILTAMTTMGGK